MSCKPLLDISTFDDIAQTIVPCMNIRDPKSLIVAMSSLRDRILAIREEHDTTKRFKLLQDLNNSLPLEMRVEFPSLITNAYIRKALDSIEARMGNKDKESITSSDF